MHSDQASTPRDQSRSAGEASRNAVVPAVSLADVCFAYPGGAPVLTNVSLELSVGARLGVFGPNGGGKTTLIKVILGVLEPQQGAVQLFGGEAAHAVRRGWIGYLPQRSDALWGAPLTVRQVAAMTATRNMHPWQSIPEDTNERIDIMLELVGMAELRDRPIGELSGGQQQRVFIARALAGRPRLLIFDEPTVGIDAEGRKRFIALLERVHAELGVTIILVSHDLRVIRDACDAIAIVSGHLHLHRAPEGITADVLADVFHHDIVGRGTERASPGNA